MILTLLCFCWLVVVVVVVVYHCQGYYDCFSRLATNTHFVLLLLLLSSTIFTIIVIFIIIMIHDHSWCIHSPHHTIIVSFITSFYYIFSAAHNVAIRMAQAGLAPLHRFPSAAEQRVSLQQTLVFVDSDNDDADDQTSNSTSSDDDDDDVTADDDDTDAAATSPVISSNKSSRRIKTLFVDNPIGLAAGFDKDGDVIEPLLALGFGMVEIGTVTPRPQPGNTDRPRMFRLVADRAIINRYGFNSAGAVTVLQNVQHFRQAASIQHQEEQMRREAMSRQPLWKQIVYTLYSRALSTIFTSRSIENGSNKAHTTRGLLGINIGKNKTSTTNDDTIRDYVACIATLGPVADYLVINVSSPNTPNLRDEWQRDVANFQSLLQACRTARNQLSTTTNEEDAAALPPLFVKLSPDLPDESLRAIVNVCLGISSSNNTNTNNSDDNNNSSSSSRPRPMVDGIVVTNTTTARPADLLSWQHRHEHGGLSGAPIKDVSTTCIRKVYAWTHGTIPIIGVGGISNGRDAYEKLCAGASLVQVYSSMIYHGPGVVSRMRAELATIMRNNGQRCLNDVVGTDHHDIVYTNRFISSSSSSSSASSLRDGYGNTVTPSPLSPSAASSTARAIVDTSRNDAPLVEETTASDHGQDSSSRLDDDDDEMSSLFPNGNSTGGG
jgi:dihydroorotate dehydrogenase